MPTTATVLFTRSTVTVNQKAQGMVEVVNTENTPKTIACVQVVALGGPYSVVMPQMPYQSGAAGAEGAVLVSGANVVGDGGAKHRVPFEIVSYSPSQPYAPNLSLQVFAIVTFTDGSQAQSAASILSVRPFTSIAAYEGQQEYVSAADEAVAGGTAGASAGMSQNPADTATATISNTADQQVGESAEALDMPLDGGIH